MPTTFELQDDYIELIKLLKLTGMCATGGMAKQATEAGQVKVDGHTELRKRRKIRKGQVVSFGGHVIEVR